MDTMETLPGAEPDDDNYQDEEDEVFHGGDADEYSMEWVSWTKHFRL